MKRFAKQDIINHINDFKNEHNKIPTTLELSQFINENIHKEDYDSYEDYMKWYVGDSTIKYYIDKYHLNSLVHQPKRRNKDEFSDEIKKTNREVFTVEDILS